MRMRATLLTALPLLMAMGFALAALVVNLAPGRTCHASADYGEFPVDWCYQVDIAITNTGGPLTNTAARVPFNASGLINTKQLDARVWDARSYLATFAQETDLLAESLASPTAAWWLHVPSILASQTRTITLEFGADDVQRDQGILFTGADEVAAPHVAAYNITDNLTLTADLEMLTSTAQNATIAGHWSANTGYRLILVDSAGLLALRAQVDAATCSVLWNSLWTNTNVRVAMTFANPTLTLLVDGVSQNSCNTGLGSISSVSTPFTVGTTMTSGIVREVKPQSGSTLVAHWGYNPSDMAETNPTNPFTGTVVDLSSNARTATYTFNRPQTNLIVAVGAVTLVSAGLPPPPATTVPDLLGAGNLFGTSITPVPEASGSLIGQTFGAAAAAWTGPRSVFWVTIFFGFAAVVGVGTYFLWRGYMPIVITLAGIPVFVGWKMGYLDWWALVFWCLFIILSWWATRHGDAPA